MQLGRSSSRGATFARVVLLVLTIGFGIPTLVLGSCVGRTMAQERATLHWPRVPGVILPQQALPNAGLHQVPYEYHVDGKRLVGSRIWPSRLHERRRGTLGPPQATLQPGDRVLVAYNPRQPEVSCLRWGIERGTWIFSIIATCFAASFGMLLAALLRLIFTQLDDPVPHQWLMERSDGVIRFRRHWLHYALLLWFGASWGFAVFGGIAVAGLLDETEISTQVVEAYWVGLLATIAAVPLVYLAYAALGRLDLRIDLSRRVVFLPGGFTRGIKEVRLADLVDVVQVDTNAFLASESRKSQPRMARVLARCRGSEAEMTRVTIAAHCKDEDAAMIAKVVAEAAGVEIDHRQAD